MSRPRERRARRATAAAGVRPRAQTLRLRRSRLAPEREAPFPPPRPIFPPLGGARYTGSKPTFSIFQLSAASSGSELGGGASGIRLRPGRRVELGAVPTVRLGARRAGSRGIDPARRRPYGRRIQGHRGLEERGGVGAVPG